MSTRMVCQDCGHASTSTSQALARRGHDLHSCEKERARQSRDRRVAAARRSSGTVRDCSHTRASHVHGTRTAYVLDRCRCRPCRDAASETERHRNRMAAYGRPTTGLVDAGPARAHVRALMGAGMGWKRIGAAASVSPGSMTGLLYGVASDDPRQCRPPRKRIGADIADRLLAVTLDIADGQLTDGTGTRRRLEALMTLGYSRSRLGCMLGVQRSNMDSMLSRECGARVTVATARAVTGLYDRLWDVPADASTSSGKASVTRALNDARARGFVPPLGWDDDRIDDPSAVPADMASEHGAGRGAVVVESVEYLLSQMSAPADIPARLGYRRPGSLVTQLRRWGRKDLAVRIERACGPGQGRWTA